MDHRTEAEGWYVDPFGVHQQRWFSAGKPTGLVRDDGIEAEDPPPAGGFRGIPERATSAAASGSNGDDLLRAGDDRGDTYDPEKAFVAVLDATTWFPIR